MALCRLLNLKLLSEEEHQRLAALREVANAIRHFLGPDPQEAPRGRREFRHRFLFLALEVFRREVISRGKLRELCGLAGVDAGELGNLIAAVEGKAPLTRKARAAYIPKGM